MNKRRKKKIFFAHRLGLGVYIVDAKHGIFATFFALAISKNFIISYIAGRTLESASIHDLHQKTTEIKTRTSLWLGLVFYDWFQGSPSIIWKATQRSCFHRHRGEWYSINRVDWRLPGDWRSHQCEKCCSLLGFLLFTHVSSSRQ